MTAFVAVFVTVTLAVLDPDGVPLPLPLPLDFTAPPQPAMPSSKTKPIAANAGANRFELRRAARKQIPHTTTPASAINAPAVQSIGRSQLAGGAALPAVVFTVRVTFAVVAVLLNVSDETAVPFCANEQDAPAGRFEHARSPIVAAKPLFALKVRVVLPDCPGAGTVTVEGDAVTER